MNISKKRGYSRRLSGEGYQAMNLDFYDEKTGVRLNYVEDARTTDDAVSQSARYSLHLDVLLRVTVDIVDTHSEYEIFRSRGGFIANSGAGGA